jgi:heme exporter protein D
MIEGGWAYIWSAYALTLIALGVLAVFITWRLAYWSKRARDLERRP